MGDISIIARRLSDKYVQYGYSGNGGYFSNVGLRLLEWYAKRKNDTFPQYEDMIDYLFSLGQMNLIGLPGSEHGGSSYLLSHSLCKEAFEVGTSEREIFSKILFIDYGYFFDSDERWYYIIPGPFRIKMPLELVAQNLDKEGHEFDFRIELVHAVLRFILTEYKNERFEALVQLLTYKSGKTKNMILDEVLTEQYPAPYFWEHYKKLFDFFDDWIVVKADSECKHPEKFIIKEHRDLHIETIFWDEN